MKERLVELLRIGGLLIPGGAEKIADYLLESGVLVPPVKLGQTVYAAIDMEDFGEEETYVYEYQVAGIALKGDKWFVCDKDTELNELGSEFALLTREEAEQTLAKTKGVDTRYGNM